MELNESECEVLPANKPAWGDLLRRMPALRALKVQILEDLIDDAILSSIADGILDNSVLESLELNWRMIGATKAALLRLNGAAVSAYSRHVLPRQILMVNQQHFLHQRCSVFWKRPAALASWFPRQGDLAV